ncbi:MAG: reverse transcriptase domain-containing protein [Pseudonocardiaceae bacterium]
MTAPEARFEARSYGFRPGRGCHDAIEATFNALCRRDAKRVWILDADLAAAFDRIDHSRLLDALSDFPARGRATHPSRSSVRTGHDRPQGLVQAR